jgi:hypothetical protein
VLHRQEKPFPYRLSIFFCRLIPKEVFFDRTTALMVYNFTVGTVATGKLKTLILTVRRQTF